MRNLAFGEFLFGAPIVAYLTIGLGLCVTHSRFVSPCTTTNSNIIRDEDNKTPLHYVVKHGLGWPIQYIRHVWSGDMPLKYFIFAADCAWPDQPPPDVRIFAKTRGEDCPTGTLPFKESLCRIPARTGLADAEPSYQKPDNTADPYSCEAGWLASPGRLGALCTLPSIPKVVGQSCPHGFVGWKAAPESAIVPKIEVCRLSEQFR